MPIQNSKIIEAISNKEDLELVAGGCSYNTMRVFNVLILILLMLKISFIANVLKHNLILLLKSYFFIKSNDILSKFSN